MNFWQELAQKKKPFFCIAPMADVTDAAFRRLIAKHSRHGEPGGGPDVFWTEFVSANGLMSAGREALIRDLVFSEKERPIVAQFFSSDPEKIEGAARLAKELGFDGIDINMGCPDRTIEKQGAGAAMIKNPETARLVIQAAKRGAGDLPVSVKTRVGYHQVQINEWIPMLLKEGIAALIIHARTRKELSAVPAPWERIKEVVLLRDKLRVDTLIIGNGDVTSLVDAKEKAARSGCDGVMIGRALFGNPWFFDETRAITAMLPKKQPLFLRSIPILKNFFETKRGAPASVVRPITVPERLRVLIEHTKLFEELLGDVKSFSIMKKHYKAYVTGFQGSKELRISLMEQAKNSEDVEKMIEDFLTKYKNSI